LSIAKKWAHQARYHIATKLIPIQYSSVFTEYDDLFQIPSHVKVWNPPQPPTIKFLPHPSEALKTDIPKTITGNNQKQAGKHQNTKRKSTTRSSNHELDNQTTTTVNTQASYTQDTISELQNTSQQHHQIFEEHKKRFDDHNDLHQQSITQQSTRLATLDEQLTSQLSHMSQNIADLEEQQKIQQEHLDQHIRDTDIVAARIPTLTENMDTKQSQLLRFFKRQNNINKQTKKDLHRLQQNQATHQTMITTLQKIVLALQTTSPPTPLSLQRNRKKRKPRTPNETQVANDSEDMESDHHYNDLHQIHAIASLRDLSTEQISFIEQPSTELIDLAQLGSRRRIHAKHYNFSRT
jgi:DNA repair exonuclease SbcCD ATPase subunit